MSASLVRGEAQFDGFESSFSTEDIRRIEKLLKTTGRVGAKETQR